MYGAKFAFQNRLGYLVVGRKFNNFCFVLLCIWWQIPSTSPPGGLYSEGRFNGGFLALPFWGAYIWRGLFLEFYGIYYMAFSLWTWACDQLKPTTGQQMTLKKDVTSMSCTLENMSCTMVSGYSFWQLSIDHNMVVHKDVHLDALDT